MTYREQIEAHELPQTLDPRDAIAQAIHARMIEGRPSWGRLPHLAMDIRRDCNIARRFHCAMDAGLVSLWRVADDSASWESLAGEMFDESHAASVPGGLRTIRAQEKRYGDRIDDEGVWGIVGAYRLAPDGEWIDADSVWGFVGNDWQGSGYEIDVMAETLYALTDALRKRCPTCRRGAA